MSNIFRIRDPVTGNWVGIPSLVGPKGDRGEKGDCAKAVGVFNIPVVSWQALSGDPLYNYYADATINVTPALNDDSIVLFTMNNLMDNNNVGVFSSEGTDVLTVRFYAVIKPSAEVSGRVICFNPSEV